LRWAMFPLPPDKNWPNNPADSPCRRPRDNRGTRYPRSLAPLAPTGAQNLSLSMGREVQPLRFAGDAYEPSKLALRRAKTEHAEQLAQQQWMEKKGEATTDGNHKLDYIVHRLTGRIC
jgi:hypothetical protein